MALFSKKGSPDINPEYRVDLAELKRRVLTHVAVNYAQIDGFPLILSIVGPPGIGKTYNIRRFAEAEGINIEEISSSALAHHKEGMALFPLIRHYRDCSAASEIKPALLLVDDFDRSIASGFSTVGHTIHSQLIVGFLMDLCDNPYTIPDEEKRVSVSTRRVPILMTGNDFSKMDPALVRPQRMTILRFEPTRADKIAMMRSAFSIASECVMSDRDLAVLEGEFAGRSISFFSDIVAEYLANVTGRALHSIWDYSPKSLKAFLAQEMMRLDLKSSITLGKRIMKRVDNQQ